MQLPPGDGRQGRSALRRAAVLVVASLTLSGLAMGLWSSKPASAGSNSQNLLTGDEASFKSSTGNWAAAQASLQWVGSVGDGAPGALEM
ncbi:MAG TPA: hypothetical protein VMV14_07920, partial [Acidimicrobiales bacterium]|nr:hypothetical protein [Acidimicrobiales bacterium]